MLLCTLANSGHDELTVTKCLGCGQAAICSTDHHIDELGARLILTPHLPEEILMSMTDAQKEIFIQLLWLLVLSFLHHNVKVVQFGDPLKK